VAEEQMTAEEKQRVLGIILDFYASDVPNAAPLDFKQKFNPAWKATSDPLAFVLAAAIAGIQQSQNYFKGYGQGFKGYAKRYGANYANTVTANFIGDAILSSFLKQAPRYFYKGTGTTGSRNLPGELQLLRVPLELALRLPNAWLWEMQLLLRAALNRVPMRRWLALRGVVGLHCRSSVAM